MGRCASAIFQDRPVSSMVFTVLTRKYEDLCKYGLIDSSAYTNLEIMDE